MAGLEPLKQLGKQPNGRTVTREFQRLAGELRGVAAAPDLEQRKGLWQLAEQVEQTAETVISLVRKVESGRLQVPATPIPKDPSSRPPSAHALAQELRSMVEELGELQRSHTPLGQEQLAALHRMAEQLEKRALLSTVPCLLKMIELRSKIPKHNTHFIGVRMPCHVRRRLGYLQSEILKQQPWLQESVEPIEKSHVTVLVARLAFDDVAKAVAALHQAAADWRSQGPHELRVEGLGQFQGGVLYAPILPSHSLASLAEHLRLCVAKALGSCDPFAFAAQPASQAIPHVTLFKGSNAEKQKQPMARQNVSLAAKTVLAGPVESLSFGSFGLEECELLSMGHVQEDGYYEVQATLRLADAAEVPEADDNDFKEKVARKSDIKEGQKKTEEQLASISNQLDVFREGRRVADSFQWQQVFLLALGLASFICLLVALAGSAGSQPFAAFLAALLGWLVVYAYQLQAQCQRLVISLALIKHRAARGGHSEMEIDARLEADLAGVSSAYALLQGADSRPREAVQAVLTASLVNDYLRLQALVRAYTDRYGLLIEGRDWHMDKTLAAAVLPPGPDAACHTQRTSLESLCEDGLSEAASRIGELREFPPSMSPRDVNFEADGHPHLGPVGATPGASSSAVPSSGMADTLSKTIASIEDSMNLPSWLRQIRH
ncbi:unnamed protein product [Symbiodinium natans]|uniref:A-kinase anchor protein 7-like phosphoesterase domain-containing protein n=1 Tax=Symbiodinium natans TaxID=878477 RepID=A0A812QLI5_9DINO|nr:unnamed protein product [Symbiodinium natans]